MNLNSRVQKLEASQPRAPLVFTPELCEQALLDLEEWNAQIDAQAEEWERHCEENGLPMPTWTAGDRERHRELRRQRMEALKGTTL